MPAWATILKIFWTGRPQQNAYVERFNGSMRDEVLNGEEFDSVLEARVVISDWVERYNSVRYSARRSPWVDNPEVDSRRCSRLSVL